MEKAQAEDYLTSLLNKTFRVYTTDTRMFLGHFKCTDSDRNIILQHTFEYRRPPRSTDPALTTQPMTSRFLGLVVVPGEYITRIEVEEFTSQMRDRGVKTKGKEVVGGEEGGLTVGEIGGGGGGDCVSE